MHFTRFIKSSLLGYYQFIITLSLLFFLLAGPARAQCSKTVSVTTNSGSVQIELTMTDIVITNNYCPWGYNYGVRIDYKVIISDPSYSFWTLQGNVLCEDGTDETFFNLPNGGGSGYVISANNDYSSCDTNPPKPTPSDLGCETYRLQIEGPGVPADQNQIVISTCENSNNCVEVVQISETETVYIYRCDGPFTVPSTFDDAEVLVVAGGGGGGNGRSAGGGGAGGMQYSPVSPLNAGQTYPVYVGLGGMGASTSSSTGENGQNSSFNGISAIGGGGGGSNHSNSTYQLGRAGGSGGGHSSDASTSTRSSSSQGNQGGIGRTGNGQARSGGGGGGAGGIGTSGNGSSGGNGGAGASSAILNGISTQVGITNVFAGGGGGTGHPGQGNNQGTGGSGIGGAAEVGIGGMAVPFTGSGGGAGGTKGGNGADGIVIIRVRMSALPISLQSFQLSQILQSTAIQLDWSTFYSTDIRYFEILRSSSGINNFELIDILSPSSIDNKTNRFSFTDFSPPKTGDRIYYQISWIDALGTRHYSSVLSTQLPVSSSKDYWKVYPNPIVSEDFHVSWNSSKNKPETPIHFRWYSPLGEVSEFTVNNWSELMPKTQQSIRELNEGIWILEISWEGEIERKKLILK